MSAIYLLWELLFIARIWFSSSVFLDCDIIELDHYRLSDIMADCFGKVSLRLRNNLFTYMYLNNSAPSLSLKCQWDTGSCCLDRPKFACLRFVQVDKCLPLEIHCQRPNIL